MNIVGQCRNKKALHSGACGTVAEKCEICVKVYTNPVPISGNAVLSPHFGKRRELTVSQSSELLNHVVSNTKNEIWFNRAMTNDAYE